MAVLFADGFPYDTASLQSGKRWTVGGGAVNATIESTLGRFGGRWLKLASGTNDQGYVLRPLPMDKATLLFQFGLYVTTPMANGFCPLYLLDGNSQQVVISCTSDLYLRAYRGYWAETLIATSTAPILANTWIQLEIKITIDPASGLVLIKQNGATIMNFTGNTRYSPNARASAFYMGIGMGGGGGASATRGFSDVIVMNTDQVGGQNYCNDLLGVRRVKLCMPTADSAVYKQFSRSSGADNFGLVNEVPPNDDTNYTYASAVGAKDLFVVPDVQAGASVDAVVCDIYAKNADAVASSVKGLARSNNQDGLGTEQAVASSYNWAQSVIYVDPNTGNPFTAAAFNAAEFGYQKAS